MKGYLYKKEKIAPKIHDLVRVYDKCKKHGLILPEKLDKDLDKLTDYYFESKYPDILDPALENEQIATDALESAKQIVEEVKKQLLVSNI